MITLKSSPTTELKEDGYTLLKGILDVQNDTQPVIDEIDTLPPSSVVGEFIRWQAQATTGTTRHWVQTAL